MDDLRHGVDLGRGAKWGLWDSQDDCWLGNHEGPVAYDTLDFAAVCRMVAGHMLGWPVGRLRCKQLPDDINKIRDELPVLLAAVDALEQLEAE